MKMVPDPGTGVRVSAEERLERLIRLLRWMQDLRTQDPGRECAPIVNCSRCGNLTRTPRCGVCEFEHPEVKRGCDQ